MLFVKEGLIIDIAATCGALIYILDCFLFATISGMYRCEGKQSLQSNN